jgi:hypothetical protein
VWCGELFRRAALALAFGWRVRCVSFKQSTPTRPSPTPAPPNPNPTQPQTHPQPPKPPPPKGARRLHSGQPLPHHRPPPLLAAAHHHRAHPRLPAAHGHQRHHVGALPFLGGGGIF